MKTKIYLIFILIITVTSISSLMKADENASIVIDLDSKSVTSGENFSISVYDPSIQNGTPYLVDVTIYFNNTYYYITSENENGEIWITAPRVNSYKLFTIEAFADNKMANASIVVIPSTGDITDQLIITTDSYVINAEEQFIVVVTDQIGNPIENAVVSMNLDNENSITLTDSYGRAVLIAPNQENVIVLAQKQGYSDAIETIPIIMQPSYFDNILSNQLTPIIIALFILLLSIVYVSLVKPYINNKKQSKKTNNDVNPGKNMPHKRKKYRIYFKKELNSYSNKNKPTAIENKTQTPIEKQSFQWFPSNENNKIIKSKQPTSSKNKECNTNNLDEIHQKIDKMIVDKKKKKIIN